MSYLAVLPRAVSTEDVSLQIHALVMQIMVVLIASILFVIPLAHNLRAYAQEEVIVQALTFVNVLKAIVVPIVNRLTHFLYNATEEYLQIILFALAMVYVQTTITALVLLATLVSNVKTECVSTKSHPILMFAQVMVRVLAQITANANEDIVERFVMFLAAMAGYQTILVFAHQGALVFNLMFAFAMVAMLETAPYQYALE